MKTRINSAQNTYLKIELKQTLAMFSFKILNLDVFFNPFKFLLTKSLIHIILEFLGKKIKKLLNFLFKFYF